MPVNYPCRGPGCGELVTIPSSFCADCEKERRGKARKGAQGTKENQFYNSTEWEERIRIPFLKIQSICVECRGEGRYTLAYLVDHIVPIKVSWERRRDPDNLQSLCHYCHNRKRQKEMNIVNAIEGIGRNVVVVCGPPGAGKSTYVKERLTPGDLIIDLDRIIEAISGQPIHVKPPSLIPYGWEIRKALLNKMMLDERTVKVWNITMGSDIEERMKLRKFYDAQIVVLETPLHICLERIEKDPSRYQGQAEKMREIIEGWWRAYSRDERDTIIRY